MFFSADQRYIVKQMASSEAKKLQEIIGDYSEHMAQRPNSLLCRIVHACSVVMYGTKLDFMVLENCFWNASVDISEIYDLKGSWVDRNAAPTVRGSIMRCRLCNQKYVVGGAATCPATANKVCTTAHRLYTRFTQRISTSISEAIMRPNPRCTCRSKPSRTRT
jgi:1-phosphatidylinositol-4-phosphate 5-kinase